MTSPLPAQTSKSALAESKGSMKADFFDFCAPQKKAETPSFESLISKNEDRQDLQDELEEAAAAKKRRKQVDAAAVAAQVSNDTPIQDVPDLEAMPATQQALDVSAKKSEASDKNPITSARSEIHPQRDHSDKPTSSEESLDLNRDSLNLPKSESLVPKLPAEVSPKNQTQEKVESSKSPILEHSSVQENFKKEPVEKNISSPIELKNSPDGTKPAARDASMVSLSTFEEVQTSSASKVADEPSITSVNRLSGVSAILDRSAIRSTENADSGSDASPENFFAANPALAQAQLGSASHKAPAIQAASVFKTLSTEVEKFHQSGQTQVQLELPVSDTESVKIRLSLRAGEIRSTFITESPELRDALQKAWPDFSATHRTQGIRFGESQFQDSFAQNQDAASEQGRQRQAQASVFEDGTLSRPSSKSPARISPSSLTSRTSSGRVNLWA